MLSKIHITSIILSFFLISCSGNEGNRTIPSQSTKVQQSGPKSLKIASISGVDLTVDDFKDWLGSRKIHMMKKGDKKKLLKSFLRFKMISKKAFSEGYDKEPSIRRLLERQVVNLYVQKKLRSKIRSKSPTKNEMVDFFRRNIKRFMRPEMRRFSLIFMSCKILNESECKEHIKKIRASLTSRNFHLKARKLSDDPFSRRRGGDVGFVVRPTYSKPKANISKVAIEAAYKIDKINRISSPIKSKDGYYIVKVTSRTLHLGK